MSATRTHTQAVPESHFVLPKPPRGAMELTVVPDAELRGTALLRRGAAGLRELGVRLDVLAECQDLFFAELRALLREQAAVTGAAPEAGERIRRAAEVLEWCSVTHGDLRTACRRAAAGEQPVDVLGLCHDVLHDLGGASEARPIEIIGGASHTIWGNVEECGQVIRLAIQLVIERTAATGVVRLEVGEDDGGPFVRVVGVAGPAGAPTQDQVDEFRSAVRRAGFLVVPDELGPGGAGIVLRVALSRIGPVAAV